MAKYIGSRNKKRIFLLGIVFLISLLIYYLWSGTAIRDLGYLTRPLWDSSSTSFTVVPHFIASANGSLDHACSLHGWKVSKNPPAKVYDAVVFSNELDMLEVRIRELWEAVDIFVILEATTTFTGKPKRLFFTDNKDRFQFATDRIIHSSVTLPKNENPMDSETEMRRQMGSLLSKSGMKSGDFLIVTDVDEIPRAESINLIKHCLGYPDVLHLELRNYMYSFEFPVGTTIWRPKIRRVTTIGDIYKRAKLSNFMLADAGWHCSFCFRHLEDFVLKMTSYSHADRVTSKKLLDKREIQRKICSGSDLFDMYPEAYTFAELLRLIHGIPTTSSMVDIPKAVSGDPEKFRFLLPGGCVRETDALVSRS